MRRHIFILGLLSGLLISSAEIQFAWADSTSQNDAEMKQELKELRLALGELKSTLQTQNKLIQRQQAKIEELERKVATVRAEPFEFPQGRPVPATIHGGSANLSGGEARTGVGQGIRPSTSSGPTASPPVPIKGSGLPGQIGSLLPEIGVVGDIVATSSQSAADSDGNDRISAREVELVVGGYVDPYSRFDATFAFSDFEAADIEEAYLTHWGLPWDLKGRFGRFFPRIGKTASIHRDQLSTVDEPLVIRRYFGAEGYFRSGVDLTRIFEGPFGLVLEPSIGVLEGGIGDGATTFGSTRRRPTIYSHLKTFKDLSDTSNLELGFSHLAGSKDADADFEVNVLGVDATYLNHFTPTTKLKLQSEFFLQHRDEAFSIDGTTGVTTHFDRHPWGTFVLADYRFAPRWSVGARADHVRLLDTAASHHADQGVSAFLTFYQSEWARWRLQYRHEEKGSEKTDDAVMLQGTFAIGTHKHQLQ